MKVSALLATAAFASLFAVGASAEQYQGVLQFRSSESRADVHAEAVAAAHSPDPYREGAAADVAAPLPMALARKDVRAEAVAAARLGDIYGDGAEAGVPQAFMSTLSRATVQAQARATAMHGITQGTL